MNWKNRLNLLSICILLLVVAACTHNFDEIDQDLVSESKIIEFESFKVLHHYNTPTHLLYSNNLKESYLAELGRQHGYEIVELPETSLGGLESFASKYMEVYSKFPDINNPDEQVFEQIQKDFFEMEIEEIKKNYSIIVNYYYANIHFQLGLDLANMKATGSSQARILEYDLSSCEESFLLGNPMAAVPFYNAWNDAISWTTTLFGLHTVDNGPRNAFKHGVWNALMVDKYIDMYDFLTFGTNSSTKHSFVDNAVALAKEMADAHEDCAGTNPFELARHMDLRNNHVGREYLHGAYETGFWITGIRTPDNSEIQTDLYNAANNAVCACTTSMSCIWNIPNTSMLYFKNESDGEWCY